MRPEWRHLQWKSTIHPSHAASCHDLREDSYLRIIWDWTPDSGCGRSDGPHICSLGLSWGWLHRLEKQKKCQNDGKRSRCGPPLQTDLCSMGKPIQPCQILQRLVSSAATNVFIFWAQLQSRIPPIPLVSAFNSETIWDTLLKFTKGLPG